MSRISLAAALAGLLAVSFGATAGAESLFPETVPYTGTAVTASGAPLAGTFDLGIRLLDGDGARELYAERQTEIAVTAGRFQIDLGAGQSTGNGAFATLQEAFAQHAEVLMEVSIDGQVQKPWVRLLPAGHSPATRAALSGPVKADDDTLHWKGYSVRSHLTGVQAVILGPADDNAAGPVPFDSLQMTHPYQGEGFYLGESFPLRDQPTISLQPRDVEPSEINRPRHEDLYDSDGNRYGTTTEKITDSARASLAPTRSSPGTILNFEGINNVNGVLPPDTEGAVGPNHYVQAVNLSFAIYNKSGTLISGPFNTNTLWSGFGGACQTDNSGDAIFLYDEQADRFVLTQFAVQSALAVCFAVSTTPDPTGSYYLYQFNTLRFPDYFKLGVWPDPDNNAYFMTTNSGFANQYDVYAFDRASMLQGNAVTFQAFQNHRNLHMPADVDGMTPPPTGTPGILYTFRDGGEPYFGNPPADSLDIWEFDVDWATPANSTYTNVQSFTPAEGFADFNWTVCGFFQSNCLDQPNTTRNIDSASWWPMQRLIYRNFGSHETLVGAWTVDVTGTPDWAGIRWFELRRNSAMAAPEGAGWTIYQQGTHAPDTTHRFMPSIAMDRAGNIAVGYSVTSGTTFPSIRYATRAAGDPLGTFQTEAELRQGTGAQTHSSSRWGDYSSMEVDPADGCTFWYTSEYLLVTGVAPWRTRVGTFRVPGCTDYVFGDDLESGGTGAWDSQVD